MSSRDLIQSAIPAMDFDWSAGQGQQLSGPLADVRVVELGGIGPGPFGAMLLADMGARVVRVGRPADAGVVDPVLHRGRELVSADLKNPIDRDAVLRILEQADISIEGFRPGVAERLGLGPDECLSLNPRLIYGRMTGYGQEGPLAQAAGHDINYISIAGALGAIGGESPVPPLNLVGDMGGGGMLLAFGLVCALAEARQSGQGQVVDAAIVDGTALQLTMIYDMLAKGTWSESRGGNTLDGGAPFYDAYRCSDRKYIAVGAIERQFYSDLLTGLGLEGAPELVKQWDRTRWPAAKARIAEVFETRTRDEWVDVFANLDACVTPVLSLVEATQHHHNAARSLYQTDGRGAHQPAPAPRFSRTKPAPRW